MKKLFYSLFLLVAFATVGLAQSQCVDVEEIDGSPKAPCIRQLKVTNGTLSCPTANRCTLTISGGGGTPGGSTTQVQYNNAGAFGGISGLSTNGSTTLTQTSASATAFESGPNGGTNPVFRLVNSTSSQADGVSITGLAAGSGVTLTALSSGSNAPITLTPKGTGSVVLPNGTQANPAFVFAGDTNTGLYSSTDGILNLSVDNSRAIIFTSSLIGIPNGNTIGGYSSGFAAFDWSFNRGAAGVIHVGVGSTSVGGTFNHTPTSPSQIAADQNNYNPGGTSYFQRWNTDASRSITGMTFTVTQVTGQRHRVYNVGAQNIVLVHQSASSTAANRFLNTTGADITLSADQAADLIYDGTTARWRVTKLN